MENPHQREVAVFEAALQLPPKQRQAYLDHTCGDDPELRRRVSALLDAHESEADFPSPAASVAGPTMALSILPTEKPGDCIGRYKLLQQIGEGGCGVVYMAEQEEPIRRRVALKVIKLGMDTKSVIGRFEAERQALALMDHPNIAKVLDAGATDTGRPFFVMELVRGTKITDYCDQNNLSTPERLDLFIQICHAVQHAHQKGVIHRDLKPSNILVTVNDGVAVPKVIDFGIAKATQGRLTDQTVFTAFEQFIGTPAYMSPEQAVLTSVDIDTRSDIYSLGVLLYELLTGRTPFDQKELLAAGLDEMRRTIREKEPPKPSTRLTQDLVSKSEIGNRKSEMNGASSRRLLRVKELIHVLRGDLDWIVMKCLEKDRGRRYETANGLASDIRRHLNCEPVTACPPSRWYEFQKSVRRHKFGFAATAAIIIVLAAGVFVSAGEAIRARRAEQAQIRLRHLSQANEQKARDNGQKALTEAAKSQQVSRFLREMLLGVDPDVAKGRDTTILKEILSNASERVTSQVTNQPEVEAEIRTTLGRVYTALGDYRTAEAMERRAIALQRGLQPKGNAELGVSLYELGKILEQAGNLPEAESALREALANNREVLGNAHVNTAIVLTSLGNVLTDEGKLAEAETNINEALRIKEKLTGSEHDTVSASLNDLAIIKRAEANYPQAEALFRQALAIDKKAHGNEHTEVATKLNNLAVVLDAQGKLAEAEAAEREALGIDRHLLGEEHPDVANDLNSLAITLMKENKLAEAETFARQVLEMNRKLLGQEHQHVALAIGNLAFILMKEGNLAEAETLAREAFEMDRKLLGNDSPNATVRLNVLSGILADEGKFAEAEPLAREAVTLTIKTHGQSKRDVALQSGNLERILIRQNKFDEARQLYTELLSASTLPQANWPLLLRRRGGLFARQARWSEAAADLRQALALGPDDHQIWHALAAVLVQQGDIAAYREHCRRSLERFGKATDVNAAHCISKDCLILASSGADFELTGRMADIAINAGTNDPGRDWFEVGKALAEYRLGNFAPAADWAQRGVASAGTNWSCHLEGQMVLAMAQYHLQQTEPARATLTKALEIADSKLPRIESGDLGKDWLDWIIVHTLLREARELIEGAPATAAEERH